MTRRPQTKTSDLRRRIVRRMPEILRIIKPDDQWSNAWVRVGDVRPWVISIIREIADLNPVSRRQHRKVEAAAKRLLAAIGGMADYAHLKPELEELVRTSKRRAGITAPRLNWQQRLLAARHTYELLLSGGFHLPSLTGDGPYITLTALLVEIATGRPCGTAGKACSQVFKEIAASKEELSPYHQRGRRSKRPSGKPSEIKRLMVEDIDEDRRRRRKEAKGYPSLDEILDKMLK